MPVDFIEIYNSFLLRVQNDTSGPQDAGMTVAQLTAYYSHLLKDKAKAEHEYLKKLASLEDTVDEATAKPRTSSKAKTLAEATPEYLRTLELEGEVKTLDKCVNATIQFQQGVSMEYKRTQGA